MYSPRDVVTCTRLKYILFTPVLCAAECNIIVSGIILPNVRFLQPQGIAATAISLHDLWLVASKIPRLVETVQPPTVDKHLGTLLIVQCRIWKSRNPTSRRSGM